MDKRVRWYLLGVKVNAGLLHFEDAVRRGPAELVHLHALIVSNLLTDAHHVRVADECAGDELEFQPLLEPAKGKPAVAVNRAVLDRELHELLETVPAGHVSRLAPIVKVILHRAVEVFVARARRIFRDSQVIRDLARNFACDRVIVAQVARFPHHHHAVALGLRRLGGLAVRLRVVDTGRPRSVVVEQRTRDARLHAPQTPGGRHGFNRALDPRLISGDGGGVKLVAHSPVKLTNDCVTLSPFW